MAVNYTGRDYTVRYERLLEQFRALVPEMTDLNHSNVGIAMIRLLASESDFLSFYIDWVFNSLSVDTATFKQSLINIGKALDTLPKLAPAAATEITVTRAEDVTGDITIPKYSRFERLDGVGYLTNSDIILLGTEESVSIPVTQGDLVELVLDLSDFNVVDYSKRLKYNLGSNVAAYSSVVADSGSETVWTEVESFYRTTTDDNHYCLELHAQPVGGEYDTVFLVLSKLSTDTDLPSSLDVTFVRTSGLSGNTGINTITVPPAELQDYVTVTNPQSATGGGSPESTDALRWRIPATARTQRRAITQDDYETLLTGISGVRLCETYDRNDDGDWPHLYLLIYILPEGAGEISNQLLQRVIEETGQWGHLGNWQGRYIIRDFTKTSVDIDMRVGITDGYQAASVFSSIQTALSTTYDINTVSSLKTWPFSELHACVLGVPGVSWVEFNAPMATVNADNGCVLQLGTITITQGV